VYSQEILRVFWDSMGHNDCHNSPPLDPVLIILSKSTLLYESNLRPVFNITIPYMCNSSKWFLKCSAHK
jgi:hypothetical protein